MQQQEECKDEETPLLLSPTTSTPIQHHHSWDGRGWFIYAQPHPPSAAALSTSRGWLATTKTHTTAPQHRQALELAVWNFGAQGLANIGLLTVPSARAAFLTQTSVVWTPFLSCLVHPDHRPQRHHWWASLVCLCGLGLLSLSHETPTTSHNHNSHAYGHVLLLLAAGCWSMYIVRLSILSVGHEEVSLQACKNVYLATLYSLWWLLQSVWEKTTATPPSDVTSSWYSHPILWCLLLYSALGPGTVADIGQQHGQSLLKDATESNVWLSLEPVFTAMLGYFLLKEPLSWAEVGEAH